MKASEYQYEVLNPWAEADPIPMRGISPRVADLGSKTIGLFATTFKVAAKPILDVVERKLREKLPKAKFSWFIWPYNLEVAATDSKAKFEEWVKGVDAVVVSVGD